MSRWSLDDHRTLSKTRKEDCEQKHQYNMEHSTRQECDVVTALVKNIPKVTEMLSLAVNSTNGSWL